MTSKSSFWVNCRENLKRRSWTLLLCALALFLALPVRLAMELSVESRRILQDPSWTGGKKSENGWEAFYAESVELAFFSSGLFPRHPSRRTGLFLDGQQKEAGSLLERSGFCQKKVYRHLPERGADFAACYLVMLVLTLVMGAVMEPFPGRFFCMR